MKIAGRKFKAAQAISLVLVLAVFLLSDDKLRGISPSPPPNNAQVTNGNDAVDVDRLPSSIAATNNVPHDDPDAFEYLIIHYHKTGHDVAHRLTEKIRPYFRNVMHNPLLERDHDPVTKCPREKEGLRLGLLNIQTAPDFFCDVNILAEELLHQRHAKKRGIKIIHLVRNPFLMAVSNYKYHAQNPTPERWVKGLNVCREEEDPIDWPDLLVPTLGPKRVGYRAFERVLALCQSLFQTRAGLEQADYYTHLMALDSVEGLLLATTLLMRGKLGDIARMANNIIKLQQLQEVDSRFNIAQHRLVPEKRIQVMTLTMEEFTIRPKETAMRFFDFLLRDPMLTESKESMAREYEQDYLELKNEKSTHITGGNSDNEMLESYLREHELFGRILGNIERVVNEELEGS